MASIQRRSVEGFVVSRPLLKSIMFAISVQPLMARNVIQSFARSNESCCSVVPK